MKKASAVLLGARAACAAVSRTGARIDTKQLNFTGKLHSAIPTSHYEKFTLLFYFY